MVKEVCVGCGWEEGRKDERGEERSTFIQCECAQLCEGLKTAYTDLCGQICCALVVSCGQVYVLMDDKGIVLRGILGGRAIHILSLDRFVHSNAGSVPLLSTDSNGSSE